MKKFVTLSIAALTAMTIAATSIINPAEARDRHRNGDVAAGIILGAVGGAIIASEINRNSRHRSRDRYERYDRPAPVYRRGYDDGYRPVRHNRYQREIYVQPRLSRWERHVMRCQDAYSTYDERSDTFIARNGREYRCDL